MYADVQYRVELSFYSLNQKPLTLALSQRERGLIAVFGRGTPTCDTESNSDFEKPKNRLPLPRERAGVRGSKQRKSKAEHPCSSPLNRMSVSSAAALDL